MKMAKFYYPLKSITYIIALGYHGTIVYASVLNPLSRDSDEEASLYFIYFLHYWIFVLGVPLAVGLAVFQKLKGNDVLEVCVS